MKGGRSKADAVGTDSKLKSKGARAGKRTAKPKAAKDPNKPKRPPSAFFVFMEEFRKQFKEAHPNNKSVATVGKAAGEKWKSMSEDEKAPFVERAEKRKSDYNKNMQDYNKQLENESDKSKSEVNDEDDEEGSGEEEDDD
ncbi:High mobility group B protein 4 [Citrus sinensis]|uniref:High mobility group B protein 4 n=1 Tax=Citrus sinensis TaxID=2711 RepID=A0ACB8J0Z9_CITSI|nr:High mobility group B protein 4 [Citrus sinensis]